MPPTLGARCRHLALLAVMAAAMLLPAEANAASLVGKPLEKAIWGPTRIDGVSQFPTYKDLDVSIYQIQLRWEDVARRGRPADPTNPADRTYRWPEDIDFAIEEAARHGIKVLILIQGTPAWASPDPNWMTPPRDNQDFVNFVTAAARKYPSVRHWMIWGETSKNLKIPGTTYDLPERKQLARIYADMLDRSYAALKAESSSNLVIGGNTFTTNKISVPGAPVPVYEWMRNLRLPNGKPPRMDMWGHNPFTGRITSPRRARRTAARGDFADLPRFLRQLRRRISRPLRRPIPVFISEFCLPTGPNPLFDLELSQAKQASWLRLAFSFARRERYIYSMGWWDLRDASEAVGNNRAYRCGLLDAAGQPKRAYQVFKRARSRRG